MQTNGEHDGGDNHQDDKEGDADAAALKKQETDHIEQAKSSHYGQPSGQAPESNWAFRWLSERVRALVTLTAILTAATVAQAYYACRTWSAMGETNELTRQSIQLTKDGLALTEKSLAETRRSNEAAERSATSSARANELSEQGMADSRKGAESELRAYVYPSAYRLDREPSSELREFTVRVRLINQGRTVARHAHAYAALSVRSAEPSKSERETLRHSISPDVPMVPNVPLVGTVFLYSTQLTPEIVAAYRTGTLRLYFWGRVVYEDIFGSKHWTEFCLYRIGGMDLDNFTMCSEGNDSDRN